MQFLKQTFLTLMLLTISTAVLANNDPNYTLLDAKRAEAARKAIKLAIEQDSNLIAQCNWPWGDIVLSNSRSNVYLNNSLAQPLYIVSSQEDANTRKEVVVTTSKDFKKILSVIFQTAALKEVNKGDLLNPEIVTDWVVTVGIKCTPTE